MGEAEVEEPEIAPEGEGDPEAEENIEAEAFEELVAEAVAEEENGEAEDEEEDMPEVLEHLKDAVEGSFRLKRLLSRDEDETSGKKQKQVHIFGPEETALCEAILKKWNKTDDKVVRHVLEQLPMEELDELHKSNFAPDPNNQWKSSAELVGSYVCQARERKYVDGGPYDPVKSLIFRWKAHLGPMAKSTTLGVPCEADRLLRALTHKELRVVLDTFDDTKTLEEAIEAAKEAEIEDEYGTSAAMPDGPGSKVVTRFSRLELIDPDADSAVFGDANLTFSIKLAKHRTALGHVGRVLATTFEDLPTLRERYKEIDESISTLEEHYAEVYHGVDCTKIAMNPQFEGLEGSLGAVYYNFPHSGAVRGFFDGHPLVNWRHENLMRLFFRALRHFVKPGGSVKVASNQGAVGVRYSYIVGSARENEFDHVETMPFLEWQLHRYGRSYGDKRDIYKRPDAKNNESYNAQAANRDMVYCFRYAPTANSLPPQQVRLPPTLKTLMTSSDGPFKNLVGMAKQTMAKNLHARFVTEVSGTHVG